MRTARVAPCLTVRIVCLASCAAAALGGSLAAAQLEEPFTAPELVAPVELSAEDVARRAQVVARAGTILVTVGDLEDRLANAHAEELARFRGEEGRQRLLDEELSRAILADEARRQSLHETPAVRRAVDDALIAELMRGPYHSSRFVDSSAEAPRIEAREEVRHALVVFARTDAELRAIAARIDELWASGELTTIAEASSSLRGVPHPGGDLGDFARGARPADQPLESVLRDALFEVEAVNSASRPIRVGSVWALVVLVGLDDAVEAHIDPYVLTSRAVVARDQAITALLEELREERVTDFHPERLSPANFLFPEDEQPREAIATPEPAPADEPPPAPGDEAAR